MKRSILNTPFHELRELTDDDAMEVAWLSLDRETPYEGKVAMLSGGRGAFFQRAKRVYGPCGLKERHIATLWSRLNREIPIVAEILKPTHVS